MGIFYVVWIGIGVVGIFLVGILFYGDVVIFGCIVGVFLIISGVIILKISY